EGGSGRGGRADGEGPARGATGVAAGQLPALTGRNGAAGRLRGRRVRAMRTGGGNGAGGGVAGGAGRTAGARAGVIRTFWAPCRGVGAGRPPGVTPRRRRRRTRGRGWHAPRLAVLRPR